MIAVKYACMLSGELVVLLGNEITSPVYGLYLD